MTRLRVVSLLGALLLLAGLAPAAAQEASPAAGIGAWVGQEPDLAAMPVTPADMEEFGFPGFGRFFNGFYASFDTFAQNDAGFFGKPLEEARAFYEGIGWSRFYGGGMGLPSVPGEDSPPARVVFANVLEVEDAAGADDYLTYISSAGPESDWSYEYLKTPFDIGDRSFIVNVTFSIPETGETGVELNLYFQLGNLVSNAGFGRIIPADAGTPAATPVGGEAVEVSAAATLAELEMLGRRHLEKMEAAIAGGAPNLPSLLLRIGDDPLAATTNYAEGYRLLNGEIRPYYAGFQDDILADPAATVGADAVYELEESFQLGEEEAPTDPYFLTRLYRFPDEAAATAFMAGRPEALATGGFLLATGATDEASAELLPGEATDLGDESMAFSFVRAFDDGGRFEGFEVYVRVGAMVAAVSLENPPGMTLDLVAEIAAAQAACLEAGACPDALPVPEALLAPPAIPDAATPAS
jgi:hypothetical protein